MKIIVISHPEEVENEAEKITGLFRNGLDIFHLRKPYWEIEAYEILLKKISPQYYRRIVIHSHFKLIEKYNLKGIHVKGIYLSEAYASELKEIFRVASKRNITISASVHTFQELEDTKWKFEYVFLSPVFDSISKAGYQAGFTHEALFDFLKNYKSSTKIYALGGIDENTIQTAQALGFEGAALLGAIWKEDDVVEKLTTVRSLVRV